MISDSPSSNCLTCLDNTKIINNGKNLAAAGRTALVLHSLPWGKREYTGKLMWENERFSFGPEVKDPGNAH